MAKDVHENYLAHVGYHEHQQDDSEAFNTLKGVSIRFFGDHRVCCPVSDLYQYPTT